MDYFKISNDKVRMKTSKDWKEWFRVLDEWGAKEKGHKIAAKYLLDKI